MTTAETLDLGRPSYSDKAGYGTGGSAVLLALFMFCLLIPANPEIGGVRLNAYRVLILVLYIPLVTRLFGGQLGKVTATDKLIFGYCLWVIISFIANHGFEHIAFAVIWTTELSGGYMLGRMLIQNAADYRRFVRFHVIIIFAMAPLAIHEMRTFHMVITEYLGKFVAVLPKYGQERYGLSRVQVVFPQSILFGLYCSIAAANVFYYTRNKLIVRLLVYAGVAGVTFTSLSSAPLLSVFLQTGLTLFDKITKGNWKLFAALLALAYIIVDILSNRSPIIVFIERFTLDPMTGWWRILIWQFGLENVWANPVFGLGLNDWVRPDWLTPSVDNFWLLIAMRNGIPALILFALALLAHVIRVPRARIEDETDKYLRIGYMIVLSGMIFILTTVHVWDALAVFIMFYIGAGTFFHNRPQSTQGAEAVDAEFPAAQAQTETAPNGTRLKGNVKTGVDYRFRVKR